MELERELLQFKERFRREIRVSAETLLAEDMPEITEELFGLYEKNGNRLLYEKVYFARRRFLAVLGLEAVAQKEAAGRVQGEVLDKLTLTIEDICLEECWALPPHVNRREEGWRVTVDLFAAETAQTLSELADRLREQLPASVLEEIRENVERRVFGPFFSSEVPYRNWEHGLHNWNGVCAGAVGSACLHLMERGERLEKCLQRICSGLQYYMKGFAEDGACTEGLGYYNYGMGYFANFAQELYDATEGRRNLFTGEWGEFGADGADKRGRIAEFMRKCFFADGRTVSFADGSSRGNFRVGLGCTLAMHFSTFIFPDFRSAAGLDSNGCYNFAILKADLLMPDRMRRFPRGAGGGTGLDILPCAQWAVARSANGAGMACKGGNNKEFHNHNDVGHFIYEGGGTLFLTDLGAGEYCRGYFGEDRYRILCNRSLGHSVPLIGGKEQPPGQEYRCGSFTACEKDGTASVDMELADAYEKGVLESFRRKLDFDLGTGRLQVRDEFHMCGGAQESVLENLVTQIPPRVAGNEVLLAADGAECVIRYAHETSVRIREQEHSNHKGVVERLYSIQWEVSLEDGKGVSEFTVSLRPDAGGTRQGGEVPT